MSATKNHRGWGYLRKLPSKRWQASYIGPDGVRYNAPITFDEKIEAELWLGRERKIIKDTVLGGQPWTSPAARTAIASRLLADTA
jgi:hypothetical protein